MVMKWAQANRKTGKYRPLTVLVRPIDIVQPMGIEWSRVLHKMS